MTAEQQIRRSEMEATGSQRALMEQRLLRARQATARGSDARSSIPRRPPDSAMLPSFAQERLWFLDQLEPGSAVYNLCQAVRLRGDLDLPALEHALNEIVRRHEVLRANFVLTEGRPVHVVAKTRVLPVRVVEVSSTDAAGLERALHEKLQEESRRPFDFANDLLIRAVVIRAGPTDHTLLLTMHHIISDGWSLGILFRELAQLYPAACNGGVSPLAELPLQFADYARWEREQMQGPTLEHTLAYWKKQLGGPLPALEFPLDHPRPAGATARGGLQSVTLSRELTEAIKAMGQQEGATLFMTLLAVLQVLLFRWTGEQDVVVGTVVAGRRRIELEKLLGFFVNTLVLRTDLGGSPSFRTLLARVRETSLAAMAHQDLPFDVLVKELRPDRAVSRNPLFQVMFVLQNAPMTPAELTGLTLEPVDVDTGTTKFDLTLAVVETPDGLRAGFEYNADVFEADTIARLLGSYRTLLESSIADPERSIAELEILNAEQKRILLRDWNRTERAFPRERTIPALVEDQVNRVPDAIALRCGDRTLTYQELNTRANQLAHRLRRWGVGPDTLVAICLERSPEMIVAVLGILKAGGAYVSLDPSYPGERLAFMLADSLAPVVLTVERLRGTVPELDPLKPAPRVFRMDTEWSQLGREETRNPAAIAGPAHLAYVSYTSGSTGQPKGVAITHRSVLRLLLNADYIKLGPDEVIAQMANCAFDASTFEIWGALLHGGQLAILPAAIVLSPGDLATALETQGVTTLFVTTALFNQLVEVKPDIFRSLRQVLFGGEAVNPARVRDVLRCGPPGRLLHVYGPTEATTFATWWEVRDVPANAVTLPIGRPLANTTAYVFDERRQPVPVGVAGELYIGGEGLARGYWRRPELDRERFVAHPYDSDPAERLYRTGDRVRWRADGALEFLGRFDRQVKIRGFRIEPGEIESALQRHPRVRQSVVVVKETASGEHQLIAYVAAERKPAPSGADLRQYLQTMIPDYMVPSFVVVLDTLPLNANGKLDRRALPDTESQPQLETGYLAPRDDVEQKIAEIWTSILGLTRVGVRDRFFELGGHSLLAVQMVARLAQTFGRTLPVSAIFEHGTIGELAPLLRTEAKAYASATSICEIQAQGGRPPLYLVHGVGGGMFWGYANLARHLGPDQPVLAFKSRGLDGLAEWPGIEELATHYVADLRLRQPAGPYQIGGYCFGGIVAYEMARQLERQGETVATLALINCSPPNTAYEQVPEQPEWSWQRSFLRNVGYWLGCFVFRWTWQERVEFVRWKWRILRKRTRAASQQEARALAVTDVDEMVNIEAYSEDQRKLWQLHVEALRRYQPQPYGGRVTLLRTRGHAFLCSFDELYGWEPLVRGGITLRIVPGGHGNILAEPHVQTVARELERELAGCIANAGSAVKIEPIAKKEYA